MKHQPTFLGRVHDGFCRCPACKPAPDRQHGLTLNDVLFALIILLIVLAMAAIMPGGR